MRKEELMALVRPALTVTPYLPKDAASATPSAVLVDAEGKVASDIAVGAPAVLEMAGASRTGS